ncbi:hypothetical protein SAMN04488137_2874 [Fictibacillus solisalsi]|uniref:YtkA-like n=1 Tax=Fictibacillus solisalsi TaxID=459525 RepID=A0A1G9XN42_9BACL|nr:hypothetical protein [Fictibacillus solisalsi]SDM97625.1 hypothetical protein SAMN04488137_2874 [Fictibacillus solisalsi]
MPTIIRKWVLSAAGILILIMAAYGVYNVAARMPENGAETQHNDMQAMNKTVEQEAHSDHGSKSEHNQSEVKADVDYHGGEVTIELKDIKENPVNQLEVNHEKLMHFIVVSRDLKQYYHFHPQKAGSGLFKVQHKLAPGSYRSFVDIKPKTKAYAVAPVNLQVGNGKTKSPELTPDSKFTKTVSGYQLSMSPSSFKAGEPVTLSFKVKNGHPEPYLGARGHVVILNHTGEKYVHVHPVSDTETVFETKFEEPGLYKLWAEFKLKGKVITYPFIVNVKR